MQQVQPTSVLLRIGRELVIPLGVILAFGVLCSFFRSSDFLFFFAAAFVLAVWFIVVAVRTAATLWKRRWYDAAALIATTGLTFLLARPVAEGGDYVHLATMYPFYMPHIRAGRDSRVTFDWGGDGFVGAGSADYFLVFDPLGTVANEREWTPIPNEKYPVGVRRLIGKFYLRTVYYP